MESCSLIRSRPKKGREWSSVKDKYFSSTHKVDMCTCFFLNKAGHAFSGEASLDLVDGLHLHALNHH